MNPTLRTVALLAVTPAWGVAQSVEVTSLDDAGSEAEVVSVFSVVPPTGYAPVRVKVKNEASVEQTITISAMSSPDRYYRSGNHQMESSFPLAAPANKTTEREFLVPVCGVPAVSSGADLRLTVSGGDRSGGVFFEPGGQEEMAFTAFSKALAERSIADINKDAQAKSSYWRTPFAGLYDAAMLPADWRGYSGLDVMAISADEWMAVQPGVRSAILQWVKLGGIVHMYQESGGPGLESLGIRVDVAQTNFRWHIGEPHAVGSGVVSLIAWDGKELTGTAAREHTKEKISAIRREEYGSALSHYEQPARTKPEINTRVKSPLMEALGEKDFAAWQVGLIQFIFGIMVGPVNLFYFAKAGRRHRLFYTTPLISIAAAMLLLAVIFFQDGTGGKGHRASVVYLDAGENAAFVHQYQVCRTGVLFGGSFETDDSVLINMAVLPASRWNRLRTSSGSYSHRAEPQRYTVSGKSYAGDWFQSRTEQGQILDAVLSTRGRLELKPGSATPVITSTLTAPLDRVFYVDAAGKHWTSPGPVTTGATIALIEATRGDFIAWREKAIAMLPEKQGLRLAINDARNFFYASSTDPRAGMVETLESIEWESDHVFLYGPLQ